jgi:hypothetical protein
MSLSIGREADLRTAKSGKATLIVVVSLVVIVVALCTANSLFWRGGAAVQPSEMSSLVGP